MSSELELLRQRISELETKNAKLEAEKAEIDVRNLEVMAEIVELRAELKNRIEELEKSRANTAVESTRRDDRVEELEQKIQSLRPDSHYWKRVLTHVIFLLESSGIYFHN